MKPLIIAIAGESGVGKSTIAEIISLFCPKDETLLLSTDDLHKYVRNDPAWQRITHPDPEANNLEMGDAHLLNLRNNGHIYRSFYDHHTGYFLAPIELAPKPVIIIEGLHAFYTPISRDFSDLKIYVDTDEELAIHWKLIRDTAERGYSRQQVLENISRRREANQKIRAVQKPAADLVISIKPKKPIRDHGNAAEEIELQVEMIGFVEDNRKPLVNFILEYLARMDDFLHACRTVGGNIELCQGAGGNISAKADGAMIVKASGRALKGVNFMSGYSVIDHTKIPYHDISHYGQLNFHITNSAKLSNRHPRPSMEAGLHAVLNATYVLHAHPVYLTLLLCLQDAEQIMKNNIPYFDRNCICLPYLNPGFELYKAIDEANQASNGGIDTFFLQNHGVVLAGNDMQALILKLQTLNDLAWQYINGELGGKKERFSIMFANVNPKFNGYLFPDDAVMTSEPTRAVHNYIEIIGTMLGKVRYLSGADVAFLSTMEAQHYRNTQI